MRGKGAARRFDYLVEPQDGSQADDGDGGDRPRPARGAHRKPAKGRQTKLLTATAVLATVAGTAAIALLLSRTEPAERVNAPVDPRPASTATTSTATPQPPAPAPPAPPAPAPAGVTPSVVVETAEATVAPAPQPAPSPAPPAAPTTVTGTPEATVPASPTTRAPISVAPESRAPFPNQAPPEGGDRDRGGLLGGGGLL